jgi:acyl-CoA synthetase (NDP forming)
MSFGRLLKPRSIAVFGGAQAQEAAASMVENGPSPIIELDINPLILLAEGQGVVAADAPISLNTKPTNDP